MLSFFFSIHFFELIGYLSYKIQENHNISINNNNSSNKAVGRDVDTKLDYLIKLIN